MKVVLGSPLLHRVMANLRQSGVMMAASPEAMQAVAGSTQALGLALVVGLESTLTLAKSVSRSNLGGLKYVIPGIAATAALAYLSSLIDLGDVTLGLGGASAVAFALCALYALRIRDEAMQERESSVLGLVCCVLGFVSVLQNLVSVLMEQ